MSRRLQSGSRSARKGSRDRNASGAWRLAALASLVFRSALTPEHAEGRWAGDGPFFEVPPLMAPAIRLRDERRGARVAAAVHREGGRLMVVADTDPPRIGREVVDPVWPRATQFLDQ